MDKVCSRRKQFRNQLRKRRQNTLDKKAGIREGDEFFVHTPAEGGAYFITPIKMMKSSCGELFSISPAYTTKKERISVLEHSHLRRDNVEIEMLLKKLNHLFLDDQTILLKS